MAQARAHRAVRWIAALACAVQLLSVPSEAGSAKGMAGSPEPPAGPAAPPVPFEPPRTASAAPDFALPDLRGNLVASGYGSRKATVVHFWATWCVPCMREIPEINRLASVVEARGGAFFAIALDSGTAGELRQIARAYDIRHTVLLGDAGVAGRFGGVPQFPSTVLVDGRGQVLDRFVGATPETRARLATALEPLLPPAPR